MTEVGWLAGTILPPMLDFLCERPEVRRRQTGRRKLRLWGCGCCRLVWSSLTDERSRKAVEMAECWADDGPVPRRDIATARQAALAESFELQEVEGVYRASVRQMVALGAYCLLDSHWRNFAYAGLSVAWGDKTYRPGFEPPPSKPCADLVRDIFGNPFRPVTLAPSCRTPTVTGLAETIYQERAFDRLPILADALEDAGCTNADILNHCRQPGDHVRGCWVIDLLTGRAVGAPFRIMR